MDRQIIIIMLVILSIGSWYFKPTSEVMICNEDYLCNIEQVRFGHHITKKTFKLSPFSIMSIEKKNISWSRHSQYVYYVTFIDTQEYKPFTYYTYELGEAGLQHSDLEKFQSYKNNPQNNNFVLHSLAGKGFMHSFIPSLIIWILVLSIVAYKNSK